MKRAYLSISYLAVFFFLLAACREDTVELKMFGSLVGSVFESGQNIAVEGVTISTTPATSLILTDDFGRFELDNIEVGTYTVRAEKDGFKTVIESITVFENKVANVIIQVEPDSLTNAVPSMPNTPSPTDKSLAQPVDVTLSWMAEDTDQDQLTYDILLCSSNQTNCEIVVMDHPENFIELKGLAYNTVYFWQVVAKDSYSEISSSIWSFETNEFPNNRFVYAKKLIDEYQIFSSNEEGDLIQLTADAGSSWRPRISPNREQIAFLSNKGIDTHIFVMNRDGSNLRQVTKELPIRGYNNMEVDFSWSPDGTQLLYMNNANLFRIRPDGTGLNHVAEAPQGFTFSEVDWTGQQNLIVARVTGATSYESDIFLINEEGEYVQQIFSDIPGATGGLQFSTDGNLVLYTHDISGFENETGRLLNSQIFLRDLRTNSTTNISQLSSKELGTNDLDPRFSPDGSKIIFVNTNNDGISRKQIMVMDIDGLSRTMLFDNATMPDWR